MSDCQNPEYPLPVEQQTRFCRSGDGNMAIRCPTIAKPFVRASFRVISVSKQPFSTHESSEQRDSHNHHCFRSHIRYQHQQRSCGPSAGETSCRFGRGSHHSRRNEGCLYHGSLRFCKVLDPLHCAKRAGHLHIVQYLVEEMTTYFSLTPLHVACYYGTLDNVKFLLERDGIDVDVPDCDNMTPLHIASHLGFVEIVEYLRDRHHAKIDAVDSDGCTALHLACRAGNLDVVRFLARMAPVDLDYCDICNRRNETPLYVATCCGRLEVVQCLFEESPWPPCADRRGGGVGITPLQVACLLGRLDIVVYLVEFGCANVEYDGSSCRALFHACCAGHLDVVKYLVENCNANIAIFNNCGESLLSVVVQSGRLDILQVLVQACGNAAVETASLSGSTASLSQ